MRVKRKRSSASRRTAAQTTPSIKPKNDGATVHRGITICAPIGEVRRLWKQKTFPGKAEFSEGPGDRGTELRVTAITKQQRAIKEIVTAYSGDEALGRPAKLWGLGDVE